LCKMRTLKQRQDDRRSGDKAGQGAQGVTVCKGLVQV
jgi:hypothetical protein